VGVKKGTERQRKGEERNKGDADNISLAFCGPNKNRERFGLLTVSS